LPTDERDKWQQFKAYNKRDVEAEIQIQQRLIKFPVPEDIWDEYHLDQEINDRGIKVDMDFVKQAIAMDDISHEKLLTAMQQITNLDNPNSV
jgi:DNA polymerase